MTAVKVGMLVRRPPADVFRAFTDPAVTTRFWFTRSSGPMTAGAELLWEWQMYGVATKIAVREVEPYTRIVFGWHHTTVELRFVPHDLGTYVQVTETGLTGSPEEIIAHVGDSTNGFTTVLCGLKSVLEHDLELNLILDHHPSDLNL